MPGHQNSTQTKIPASRKPVNCAGQWKVSVVAFLVIACSSFAWCTKPAQAVLRLRECAEESMSTQTDELKWKANFRRAYGLDSGVILKRFAAPFPAGRSEFIQSLKSFPDSFGPAVLNYYWDGQDIKFGMGTIASSKPIGWTLIAVLGHLGVPYQELEGDKDLLRQHIEGEFVARAGTPAEKLVPRLEQILREELNLRIRLELTQQERDVIVVAGKYESRPLSDRRPNTIDLFAINRLKDSEAGGGIGTLDEFLNALGTYINRRIVCDVVGRPIDRITWFYHNSTQVLPDPNQDPDGVIRNVIGQSGLLFRTEKRMVRVLQVKKQ